MKFLFRRIVCAFVGHKVIITSDRDLTLRYAKKLKCHRCKSMVTNTIFLSQEKK